MAFKQTMGATLAAINTQCRFARCIFVLGHMRCGSTALSHILCNRPEVSGYGEAHIRYDSRASLGTLVLNQWRRGAWRREATYLFDKILHTRYDQAAHEDFYGSRTVFVARSPVESIASIRHLFERIGSGEYATDAAAADYYEERLQRLLGLWQRFPPANRFITTHDRVTSDPDAELSRLSYFLRLNPPLDNSYHASAAARARGAGDPLQSHKHSRIVGKKAASSLPEAPSLSISSSRVAQLEKLYEEFEIFASVVQI